MRSSFLFFCSIFVPPELCGPGANYKRHFSGNQSKNTLICYHFQKKNLHHADINCSHEARMRGRWAEDKKGSSPAKAQAFAPIQTRECREDAERAHVCQGLLCVKAHTCTMTILYVWEHICVYHSYFCRVLVYVPQLFFGGGSMYTVALFVCEGTRVWPMAMSVRGGSNPPISAAWGTEWPGQVSHSSFKLFSRPGDHTQHFTIFISEWWKQGMSITSGGTSRRLVNTAFSRLPSANLTIAPQSLLPYAVL